MTKMPALERIQQKVEEKIIEQLAKDMHDAMRGAFEAGKVLYRKPCKTCDGLAREYLARHGKRCDACNGTGFAPFEEFEALPGIVIEGRIMAARKLFEQYMLQRRVRKE